MLTAAHQSLHSECCFSAIGWRRLDKGHSSAVSYLDSLATPYWPKLSPIVLFVCKEADDISPFLGKEFYYNKFKKTAWDAERIA